MSLLADWHRRAKRARARSGLQVVTLPFPEDAAKAKAERYRRLFAALAANADMVVEAAGKGAVTREEALAVIERHVRRFQFDLASLEGPVQL
jgi:hypothetical protein